MNFPVLAVFSAYVLEGIKTLQSLGLREKTEILTN